MKAPLKTPAEFDALFAHAAKMRRPAHFKLMLLLSIRMGLRPCEIANATSAWFRGDELRIPQGSSKGSASRSLPVSHEVLSALHEHLQGRTGRLFYNERGLSLDRDGVSKSLRRLYERVGQVGSCYSGRRSAGQRMQDQGANILTLQAFFGHLSPLTTSKYVGSSQVQLRAAMFG